MNMCNRNHFFIIGGLFTFISIYSIFQQELLAKDTGKPVTVTSQIARPRPRVVYFYTNWCGICKQFGPRLKSLVFAYRNYIDFQQIDVGDQRNKHIAGRFHINGVPTTYVYNCKGQAIFARKGAIDDSTLNRVLKRAYTESFATPVNPPAPKKINK